MSLGERLMDLRKKKGLSQEEAADKLNVTRQTISKWELDQSTPDFDKVKPICDLYGIELLSLKKISDNLSLGDYYDNLTQNEVFELTSCLDLLD